MKEMIELKDLLVLDLPYATGFLGTLLSLICNHIIYSKYTYMAVKIRTMIGLTV